MMRRQAIVPITTTWYRPVPVNRPVQVVSTVPNVRGPAFVQTPRTRGRWHTMVRKSHKKAPGAATVVLYRKFA